MFTKQYVNKRRCNECKRRKKKCLISSDSCDYCLQKGLICTFPDNVLNFNPANGKVIKKRRGSSSVIKFNNPSNDDRLVTTIVPDAFSYQFHFLSQCKFFPNDYLYPKIFIPLGNSLIRKNGIPIVNDDKVSVNVLNKDMIILKDFTPSTYVMSSLRIKNIKEKSNVEKDRKTIERLANSTLKNKFVQFLQKNNITFSSREHILDKDVIPNIKSLDEINLYVDFKNLRNVFMIEEPAIPTNSKNKSFKNLPSFMNAELANSLFEYFCSICTDELPQASGSNVSMLTVCLPLILGNLTTMKAVLLWSYYHKLHNNTDDNSLIAIMPQMKQLHLNALFELSKRLKYYISVSCDHSIFCVFLFLTIEVINGAKGTLWGKLQNLAQSMISLRGGVRELCQTLTGDCIMKLLLNYLCTEVSTEIISLSFSFSDLKYVCDHNNDHEFFDNIISKSALTLANFKNVVQFYFRVSILRGLLSPSLGLDKRSLGGEEISEKINYDIISESNIERIMYESSILEMEIKYAVFEELKVTKLNHIQIVFASNACVLYLFQAIYRQSSLSPKTILTIKSLKADAENILKKLKNMTECESRHTTVFILPIFCYGVDLVGVHNRSQFINDLNDIYKLTKKEMIKSAIDLLWLVWEKNSEGQVFVDWKAISTSQQINISLCC